VNTVKAHYEEYWSGEDPSALHNEHGSIRLRLLRAVIADETALRILDAGCGAGDLVAALSADGHDARGMDVSSGAIARALAAAPSLRFDEHAVEELPWPVAPESQDVVVSFEVIEHLLRPDRFLAGARDALRRGGRLVLTTPYHGFAKNLALVLLAFDRHFDPTGDHIRFFTDAGLRRLLEAEGFEVGDLRHFGRVWPISAGTFVVARKR
jgi:2-polyprenyl-3-methyl-5-hydroxy-6-metoxy-1,4-benzoquinol methylase